MFRKILFENNKRHKEYLEVSRQSKEKANESNIPPSTNDDYKKKKKKFKWPTILDPLTFTTIFLCMHLLSQRGSFVFKGRKRPWGSVTTTNVI